MGFLHRDKGTELRFKMREDLFSFGDDYWIEDSEGNKAFRVNGKALAIRDTWVLEDASGKEVATIRERKLSMRDAIKIHVGDQEAEVKKALIGLGDRFHVELDGGKDLKANGNVLDHEYEIKQDGDQVAEISKKWFRVRDTYGVTVKDTVDPALILAITVAIEAMARG